MRAFIPALVMGTVVALAAQQPAAPIVSIKTNPDTFPAGAPTTVVVQAQVAPQLLEAKFRAFVVRGAAGEAEQVLVEMTRSGRTLTGSPTFNEAAAGRVALRIKLVSTSATPAVRAPQPVYSSPFFLSVQAAQAPVKPFPTLSFSPEAITAGERSEIQITATLAPALARNTNVTAAVMRVSTPGPDQKLGELTRTGNTVSGRITVNEPAEGRIPLRLVAIASATFSAAAAAPPSSEVFSIVVRPRAQVTTLEAGGLRASWPKGWTANQRVTASGGPWSGNNFKNAYATGGVIPARGCEIEATSRTLPAGDLADFIRRDTDPAVTIAPTTVRTFPGFQTTYDEEFTAGLRYRITAVYIPVRDRLFKVFLSRRVGDPAEAECQDGLRQMLETFTPTGGGR